MAVVATAPVSGQQAGGEADLTAFLNNVGIQRDPTGMTANFDGGGYAYSGLALQIGDPVNGYAGVEPGDTLTAGGLTFTWPDRPVGASDNVSAVGQTVPVPIIPGATKIGFLGAGAGDQAGTLILNYTFVDSDGVEQEKAVATTLGFTDWTRGLLGDTPLRANEVIVLKTLFRTTNNAGPFVFTNPHVFLATIPLDPTMTLTSVKLPLNPQIHVFGVAVGPEVTVQAP